MPVTRSLAAVMTASIVSSIFESGDGLVMLDLSAATQDSG